MKQPRGARVGLSDRVGVQPEADVLHLMNWSQASDAARQSGLQLAA